MREAKWTSEQLAAITEKGCNILVAAAAGAGKTAVLVERIIRKITDANNPVDIDRLLVVTFTNAAAAEMRERIGDAIAKEIERNPASNRLHKQLTLLNRASITTIHSFCLEVIRNNFYLLDIDPNFRIADETESMLLKMEALEELFEQKYEKEILEQEFLELVECYGGSRDDRALQDMVIRLYDFVQSHPWPEKWLDDSTEAFNLAEGADFSTTRWAEILVRSINIELRGLIDELDKAVKAMEGSKGFEPYIQTFKDDISILDMLARQSESCSSWDALYNAFNGIKFKRLAACGKDIDRNVQEYAKAVREEVKQKIKKFREEIFIFDSRSIAEDLRKLYPLMKCLSGLVKEFGEIYAAKKRNKSLLDFNDLEHLCLDILVEHDGNGIKPSNAALVLKERFEEILIDEYQDSNLVQEIILNSIARKGPNERNIFMVGDVKQSIYRFRQARPELFLEKYNSYPSESGHENRKILLYKNFRSRKEILDGVNFVFSQIMSQNIGELDYDENEALKPGLEYVQPDEGKVCTGEIEVNIIDEECSEEADRDFGTDNAELSDYSDISNEDGRTKEYGDDEEEPDVIQAEARIVARRIKELIGSKDSDNHFMVYDKGKKEFRPIKFRDIVILMRATQNWADVFVEELNNSGIPCYADTGTGFFKTIEVQTILSLLQVIDNPMQDIPLLSVLRSPIASFDTQELIDIRAADDEATFYEAMKKFAEENICATAQKAENFLKNLARWRDSALYMPTDELIWYLYTDTGYYSYAGAMPGGAQRQANLRMLFEWARQYEGTSYRGLFNFINFINKLKSSQSDMGSAKIIGENEDVVRIMSIHKSKGLEFPVVIVAGCGKRFNMADLNSSILLHQDLGFGPDFVDYKRRISYTTPPKYALRHKMRLEALSEEMRILYVAFTRAREKLIITGTVKDIGKTVTSWLRCASVDSLKLQEYDILRAKRYLDWIGPCIIRHKDCQVLREKAGIGANGFSCLDDSSSWHVRLWNKKDLLAEKEKAKKEEQEFMQWIREIEASGEQSPYSEEIKRRLDWRYGYEYLHSLPTKISVTELKKYYNAEFSEEYMPQEVFTPHLVEKPLFLEEDRGLNPAEKGIALHFVMQRLDLDKISAIVHGSSDFDNGFNNKLYEEIGRQLGNMVEKELLTAQQSASVDIKKVAGFFSSDLGRRMLKSEKIYREAPFNLEFCLEDLYFGIPQNMCKFDESDGKTGDFSQPHTDNDTGTETILLQGVIDCFFEEDDGIVLIDYKTDYVPNGGTDIIKKRYEPQIEYYSKALARMTGKKVKERYIYLFWNGEVIKY
ncbi:MAG TPA: helicase-exonuclease AddAB subunit AddA [Clostridiaceae bacterium]|nr:helicase-exonuclease AddAB subunit AddA [Clostridiaceae bacterium]